MTIADERELRRASTRLAIQFAALILVLFALLGVVVVAIVSASQSAAAADTVQDASRVDSPHDAADGVYLTIVDQRGTMSSPDLPPGLPDRAALDRVTASGGVEQATETLAGRSFLVRTSSHDGRVVQAAYDRHEQQDELGRLILALVVSGVVAAIAAAFIGVFMARRAMRPLADALALQRRFVADASHELRTPLTLLSTRAQLVRRRLRDGAPELGDGADGRAVADGVDEIVDDAKALTEIVEDLLVAADPREDGARERVGVLEVARAAADSIAPKATERGVAVELSGDASLMVDGAPISLRRMAFALLDNAVEHAQTIVTAQVVREGRTVVLRVRDDGPGFPQETAGRAFERFASARTPPDPGRNAEGASRHYGLGLALVAEVATRHGGSVGADNSGPGGGASVVVTLPLADS